MNFDALEETFEEALEPTDVKVQRADDTLVFWRDGERVGLEVSKGEVQDLSALYQDETEEQIFNRVFRDAYYYLVLKYLR